MGCIWKVEEKDRLCDYCKYFGDCERWPSPFREKSEPENEDEQEPEVYDGETWWVYVQIMNSIVGADILLPNRHKELVWARNFVAYQLSIEGMSSVKIGRKLKRTHSSILHAVENAKNAIVYRNMYKEELEIWNKFQKMIHLQKSSTNEKDC